MGRTSKLHTKKPQAPVSRKKDNISTNSYNLVSTVKKKSYSNVSNSTSSAACKVF